MNVELITIGDEILIGQIVDTNSAWLANNLNEIGFKVNQITSITDDKPHIKQALDLAKDRSDIIITTGGLGPTKDDVTRDALCEYFDAELVLNEELLEKIEKMFANRGLPITDINRRQAEVPTSCELICNDAGTAAGMWFNKDGKVFIFMPGVPFEMKHIYEEELLPRFKREFNIGASVHKTILISGIGESFMAEKIKDWEENLPNDISLAYLPSPGILRLRLSSFGKNEELLRENIENQIEGLKEIAGEFVFGYDDDKLEEIIGSLLKSKNATVSTAESCTGGNISSVITDVPGSSGYFIGSVIAYSNDIKENELGVNPQTIKEFGAVSIEVAEQMAIGIKKKFNTDYAVSTTGIAGPDGGTETKPVGTVCIAVATPNHVVSNKFLFGSNRLRNVKSATIAALLMLKKELDNIIVNKNSYIGG